MKKILEVEVQEGIKIEFSIPNGRTIEGYQELIAYLRQEFNPYRTKDDKGTLIYLSEQDLQAYETYLEERGKRQ